MFEFKESVLNPSVKLHDHEFIENQGFGSISSLKSLWLIYFYVSNTCLPSNIKQQ